jgi:hypothetical protein
MRLKGVVLASLALTACQQANLARPEAAREPATQLDAAPATSATSELLVTGNTFWGRYLDEWSRASRRGVEYPFSRLGELHRERYDAWISGLECPTVPGLRLSSAEQDRLLSFNCDPEFLGPASRWFTAFSLANNHTDNQGRAGLEETRRRLEANGIEPFGDPDPARLDQVCTVIAVRARVQRSNGSETEGHLPLGLCGFHGVFTVPPPEAVAVMRGLASKVPVLALPHSGLEYVAHPDSIKVDFYRSLIDNGADAVLGDHAHWVQPSEAWHGRLIVYSMGNFIFDQQGDDEVTRSAAIRVRLTADDGRGLQHWLDLGERCVPAEDCAALVERAHLPELKVKLGFGVVGTTNTGRVTHPASAAATRSILGRLDWSRTMATLRPPYAPIG